MTPHLTASNDAIQKIVTFSLVLVEQVLANLHTMLLLFPREYMWNTQHKHCDIPTLPPPCRHAEADIQLHTQLPDCNLLIHTDEPTVMFFISWCDNYARLPKTWLVFHIAVATAETHCPLPHCAHIHWLVSTTVQQASMNVSGCHFSCMEEFSDTPLCTSMTYTVWSDFLSAAICQGGNKT